MKGVPTTPRAAWWAGERLFAWLRGVGGGFRPRFRPVYGLALLWLLLPAAPATAQPDDLQARLLDGRTPPLEWDQLRGGGEWLAGPAPRHRSGSPFEWLTLGAGESALFRMAPRSLLRVVGEGALRLEVSEDGALFAEWPLVEGGDGRSRLARVPFRESWLARLSTDGGRPLELALFSSRRENFGELSPYLDRYPLEGEVARLAVGEREEPRPFHLLEPNDETGVTLHGPLRLAVESRRLFGERDRRAAADYRLSLSVDGALHAIHPFETVPERRRVARLDGVAVLVGEARRAYLDLPEGAHRLTLRTTAPLLLRVLGQPAAPDLPEVASLAGAERFARQLARDGAHRDGGLAARAAIERLAENHPGQPRLRALPVGRNTFFQDLLPLEATRFTPLRFVTPRLLRPAEARRLVVGEGLLDHHASNLGWARFADSAEGGLSYPLPADHPGRRIRLLALPSDTPWRLELSRGEGAARSFTVHPRPQLGTERFQYDATLTALEQRGHPVGMEALLDSSASAPLSAVAAMELPLPAGEGPLRIRGDGRVALQLERSRPYRLDEAEFLALNQRLEGSAFEHFTRLLADPPASLSAGPSDGGGRFGVQVGAFARVESARRVVERLRDAGFTAELRRGGGGVQRVAVGSLASRAVAREVAEALRAAGFDTLIIERKGASVVQPASSEEGYGALAALERQWRPLVRLLRGRHRRFSATVESGGEPLPLGPRLSDAAVERLAAEARASGGVVAVERWGALARGSRGEVRRRALLALADALGGEGEHFLAERLLRAQALRGDRAAWSRLIARAEQGAGQEIGQAAGHENDERALETLLAAAFVVAPTLEGAARLAERFAADGHWRSALLLASLLPEDQRPRPVVLGATLALGWQRTFEAALDGMTLPDELLWRGHWHARHGVSEDALAHYLGAGDEGWVSAMAQALRLKRSFASEHPVERREALREWAERLERWPGGRVWRPVEVAASAGGAQLHNRALDLRTPLFRAEPERPAVVELIGPARLRLAVRPLHAPGSRAPLDGWLALTVDGEPRRIALSANLPSEGLTLEGGDEQPGGERIHELTLGAGLHRIEAAPESGALLLRAQRALPALDNTPLPPLTPALVAALDAQPLKRVAPPRGALRSPRRLITLDGEVARLSECSVMPEPPVERMLDPPIDYPAGEAPEVVTSAGERLLAELERHPERRGALLVEAEALRARAPGGRATQAIHRRLTEGARWEALRDLEGGDGLRGVPRSGFAVESPALRLRAALLPVAGEGEELLAVGSRVGVELFSPVAERLTLRLALDRIAFLPAGALTIRWSLDDAPARRLTLSSAQPRREVTLELPSGAHYLRVAVEAGPANHYLRMALEGASAPPPRLRHYAIATAEQPLYAHLEGPAWLRVDELRDGVVVSRNRRVAAGWRRIAFTPEGGRREALLRIFRRTLDEAPVVEPLRLRSVAIDPLPAAPLALEPSAEAPFGLRDEVALEAQPGTPWGGTWSYAAQWNQRRGGDEEEGGTVSSGEDRFLELSADHRLFRPWSGDWLRGGALLRLRDAGEPTVGLRGKWRTSWDRAALDFTLNGSLYAQPLAGEMAWSARLAATLGRRLTLGPRSWHRPRATLFARALSHETAPGSAGEVVDRDVYSDYKAQHEYGLLLEESLTHRATPDRQWYGGARLASNEDFEGWDHLRLRAGVGQHLNGWWLRGEWRQTHYLSDDDRANAATRPALELRVGGEAWRDRHGRIEWGARWLADLDSGDDTLQFTLRWHDGKGYRDFAPGEIDFRARREPAIPLEPRHAFR